MEDLVNMFGLLGIIVPIILVSILLITLSYKKCPPDQVFIITGLNKQRIITGKATFIIPFFERMDILPLAPISIDVKTKEFVPNSDYINVSVDAAVKLCIDSSSEEMLSRAAKYFLNMDSDTINTQIKDTLEGNIREIIGQLNMKEMVTERKAFAEKVQENAGPDLEKFGLTILSFNIQGFEDQNGVIKDLGVDNIEQIRKGASISKNVAVMEVEVSASETRKVSNDAKIKAEREIALAQNTLELEKAALREKEQRVKAKADASYEIEKEAQRKTIEELKANADIMKLQKEIEISELEVQNKEKELDASIRKEADANFYRRQKEAESTVIEAENEAKAILLKAEADAKAIELREAAIATGVQKNLLAEAEGLKAKLLAEAEGISQKADAMKKFEDAAMAEMYFKALPEIAKEIAKPLGSVKDITMYGEGNISQLTGDITKTLTQVSSALNDSLGVNVKGWMSKKVRESDLDTQPEIAKTKVAK